jgi:hypothetical protein
MNYYNKPYHPQLLLRVAWIQSTAQNVLPAPCDIIEHLRSIVSIEYRLGRGISLVHFLCPDRYYACEAHPVKLGNLGRGIDYLITC